MSVDSLIEPTLAAGEETIWRAEADWSRAARPPRRGLALARLLALALATTFGAAAVIGADPTEPNSAGRSLFAAALLAAMAALVVVWGQVARRLFALFETVDPRVPALYLLTNDRLIVVTGEAPGDSRSVTLHSVLMDATSRANGLVYDVTLWFAARDDDEYFDYQDPLVLRAVPDGPALVALLVQRCRARRAAATLPDDA